MCKIRNVLTEKFKFFFFFFSPESSEPKLVKSSRFLLSLSLLDEVAVTADVWFCFLTTFKLLLLFILDTLSFSATNVAVDDEILSDVFASSTSISADGGGGVSAHDLEIEINFCYFLH